VPVPLQLIASRLDCSADRAAGLLAEVAGVRVDAEAGVCWLVDVELAAALKDAFGAEGRMRPVREMRPPPIRHAQRTRQAVAGWP
jgi:hypothetical protein